MKFIHNNCLVERCIMEEPFIFVPGYMHLFTERQYRLIMNLYNYLIDYVFDIKNQTVFYINIPIEREMENIKKRGRNNEASIYTPEFLQRLRGFYDTMLQSETFRQLKSKGRLYNIEWDTVIEPSFSCSSS